jgi:DNA-binding MarR family transcriptional regulator
MDHREPVKRDDLEKLRQENFARLGLRLFRAFNARAVEMLRAHGYEGITLAHTALLVNLDTQGTRIVDLADRAGISKQAMGRLAQDLEERGYVRGSIDPTDRRAMMVTFTELGRQFLNDGVRILRQIEADYASVIGQEQLAALRASMLTLVHHAERDSEVSSGHE